MLALLLITGAAVLLAARWWQAKVQFARFLPRAQPYYPVVGNLQIALPFGKSAEQLFTLLHGYFRQHDRMFAIHIGPKVAIGLSHPELVQTVLNHPDCQEKSNVYKLLRLPNGLLSSKYQIWKLHRKTLNSTFNIRILNSFLPIFNEGTQKLINLLNQHAHSRKVFNILEPLTRCTLEMVCATSFGRKVLESEGNRYFFDCLEILLTSIGERLVNVLLHSEIIYRLTPKYNREMKCGAVCRRFTEKVLEEKRVEIESLFSKNSSMATDGTLSDDEGEPFKRPQIFIDQLLKMPLMMKSAYNFSDQEISDHVFTMIIAGNETSATQTAHTCLLLAMNPEIQEKAFQEVQQIVPSGDTFIDADMLRKLVYVEAVLKESLRLLPVGALISRKNLQDIVLDGHTIPKNTAIVLNPYSLHRRPDIWGSDWEKFVPERFLGEDAQRRHPYAFIPFSAGPRGCIGNRYAMMTLKIMMAMILKNFKISTKLKYEELKIHYQISLNLTCPHAVCLERRDCKQ
ncbi:cytochrome P450 4c21-like [Armigeres subalbatus]|uniref:cytochrome P450 4c21-like n=1 Tax=Armigeres subalbatus TaxID=124917 RepID=UPI002ED3B208